MKRVPHWIYRGKQLDVKKRPKEHKGTKEGQTEEWLRSDSPAYGGKRHLFFITLQRLSPPGGFFTSFCLSPLKIGCGDESSILLYYSPTLLSPLFFIKSRIRICIYTWLTKPTLCTYNYKKKKAIRHLFSFGILSNLLGIWQCGFKQTNPIISLKLGLIWHFKDHRFNLKLYI